MLYVLPQAGPAPIVRFIEAARGQLVINNYFLDSRPILHAIADAVRHGVDVKVILELRPYRISRSLVRKEYGLVREAGAQVMSAPRRFSSGCVFDHAKYAVASNEVLIGTANWDWSGMHKNREYIFVSHDPTLIRAMSQVARADEHGQRADVERPRDLVLSPGRQDSVERKLAHLIDQPGPVGIETEELQPDNPLMHVMERKGHMLHVILPGRLSRREREAVHELSDAGVSVATLRHPYMHAKMIIGEHAGFIGSQNFSDTSLERNREVGIILHGRPALEILARQYRADYQRAAH